MINVELLTQVMRYISDHQDEWDQSTYINSCGTSMCFAGHAAVMSGVPHPTNPNALGNWFVNTTTGESSHFAYRVSNNPRWVHIHDLAAKVLKLNKEQAKVLFDPDNSLEDLKDIVKDLIEEARSERQP